MRGEGSTEVLVVRTGTANLASVLAGLERAGASPCLTDDPQDAARADRVVLPGVGAFGIAMERLRARGVDAALAERIRAGRATLAVCLGFQLLAEGSEESPGVGGLGVVPGRVARFSDTVRVPQIGWNRVEAGPGCRFLSDGFAFYANSYRLREAPSGWNATTTDHGGPFVAAIERGAVLACQFHPELSGEWGLSLLKRWLAC